MNDASAFVFFAIFLFATLAPASDSGGTLALRIVDESGRSSAARVRLLDSDRKPQAIETGVGEPVLAAHPNFPELGVIIIGEARIKLPHSPVRVVVERGTEYRTAELEVEGKPTATLERTVRLERWVNMAERGWWSGDLHVHRNPEHLPALMDAADLHFAPALICWNDESLLKAWPEKTVHESAGLAYSLNSCEDERRWGAAVFIGLRSPMALYARDAEYPPPSKTWADARSRGAFVDLEKLIWWEAPAMAAVSPPDTIGVAVNHFREDGISTRASLSRPRDETRYPGEQGFAQYILDLYSHYLSAGFRIAASAGSANGVAKNALGYNRSYVYLGEHFSYDKWLAAQKAGRNFVTNGPMLFATVNGELPGYVFDDNPRAQVKIDALSASELDRAEILVDGQIVKQFHPSGSSSKITGSATVSVSPGSWLAVRCFEKNPVTVQLAHTSPFYFGKSARRARASLDYLREWVQADMDRIQKVPENKLDASQRAEFLELCQKALEFYQ